MWTRVAFVSLLAFVLGASFVMLQQDCDSCRDLMWRVTGGDACHVWEEAFGIVAVGCARDCPNECDRIHHIAQGSGDCSEEGVREGRRRLKSEKPMSSSLPPSPPTPMDLDCACMELYCKDFTVYYDGDIFTCSSSPPSPPPPFVGIASNGCTCPSPYCVDDQPVYMDEICYCNTVQNGVCNLGPIPTWMSPFLNFFQPTQNFLSRQGSGLRWADGYWLLEPSTAAYNPTEPSESTKMPNFGKSCGISLFAKSRSPQQDRIKNFVKHAEVKPIRSDFSDKCLWADGSSDGQQRRAAATGSSDGQQRRAATTGSND